MKITVTDKKPVRGKYVSVAFSEDVVKSRFVVRGKREVLEIKIPKAKEINRRKWILLIRSVIREAMQYELPKIVIDGKKLIAYDNLGPDLAQTFAEAVMMAQYEFRTYKSRPQKGWFNCEDIVLTVAQKDVTHVRRGVKKGMTIGTGVNVCRDLANTPGEDMTPAVLVRAARKMIRGTGIRMRVLDEHAMRQKKMNGVLTVGKGSKEKSQFIILEYKGSANKNATPRVLVGKGVTFDTGGIDTKPHPYGLEMMMDMSGGAAVITTITLAAKLKLKKNIVALVPAVENMPSGESMRPGDIIRMMDGTMVEVGHTDAEGRLILADAITFAKQYKPKAVIDVATLTGAAMVALGERATAVFTNDEALAADTLDYAEETGDYAWRMPLWEEYEAEIKGTHGDIANIRTMGTPGYGGAITAATFLKHFAKDHKSWMHLDMAPTMTAAPNEFLAKGAKGSPVRLLVKLLENI